MSDKLLKLVGVTRTPIVVKNKHFFHKYGVITINGRPRVFGKLKKGERRPPKTYRAWYGEIEFIVPEGKIENVLAIDRIGRYTHEGMGQVSWLSVSETKKSLYSSRRLKTRKKLPKLSNGQKKLIIAMLLHDFVNTELHPSKIYSEVDIIDEDICNLVKNHHDSDVNERKLPFLSLLQYYDRLSASISRQFRFSTFSRYQISQSEENIDFNKLKRDIEVRQHSPYALYTFVRNSPHLNKINEALKFGFTSLKKHLLLMVNLYLSDSQDGMLSALSG